MQAETASIPCHGHSGLLVPGNYTQSAVFLHGRRLGMQSIAKTPQFEGHSPLIRIHA